MSPLFAISGGEDRLHRTSSGVHDIWRLERAFYDNGDFFLETVILIFF